MKIKLVPISEKVDKLDNNKETGEVMYIIDKNGYTAHLSVHPVYDSISIRRLDSRFYPTISIDLEDDDTLSSSIDISPGSLSTEDAIDFRDDLSKAIEASRYIQDNIMNIIKEYRDN